MSISIIIKIIPLLHIKSANNTQIHYNNKINNQ